MKVSRNVFFLGIVSFFTDVSSEMIFPVLPIFLERFIGATKLEIGIVEGVAQLIASTLKVFSGFISDRLKRRKPIILIGYGISNLTKPLLSLSHSWVQVLLIRALDRMGKGIRTSPRDALISESSQRLKSGSSFGFHRALDTLGAVSGTIIAFLILNAFGSSERSFRAIFALSALPGLASLLVLFRFVAESGGRRENRKFSISGLSGRYFKFVAVQSLFTLFSMNYAFMILKGENSGISVGFIPLAYLVYNVVYSLLSYPLGAVSDRFGKGKVLPLIYIVFSASAFLFTLRVPLLAWLAFLLYGIFMAGFESISRAAISDISGESLKGTAFGIYHTSIGLFSFLSMSLAGFLWDRFGADFPFYIASLSGIVLSPAVFRVLRR